MKMAGATIIFGGIRWPTFSKLTTLTDIMKEITEIQTIKHSLLLTDNTE